MTENGEHNEATEDGGTAVDERNHDSILVTVVVELVVRTHSYQGTETNTKGVEDLSWRLQPCLGFRKFRKLEKQTRKCKEATSEVQDKK